MGRFFFFFSGFTCDCPRIQRCSRRGRKDLLPLLSDSRAPSLFVESPRPPVRLSTPTCTLRCVSSPFSNRSSSAFLVGSGVRSSRASGGVGASCEFREGAQGSWGPKVWMPVVPSEPEPCPRSQCAARCLVVHDAMPRAWTY